MALSAQLRNLDFVLKTLRNMKDFNQGSPQDRIGSDNLWLQHVAEDWPWETKKKEMCKQPQKCHLSWTLRNEKQLAKPEVEKKEYLRKGDSGSRPRDERGTVRGLCGGPWVLAGRSKGCS